LNRLAARKLKNSTCTMSAEVEVLQPKKSMMPKLLIGGFISIVVIFESLIFFFMVPSADDVAALAEKRLVERLEEKMKAADEHVVDDSESVQEFTLGDMHLSFTPNGTEHSHMLEFGLFGTVRRKDAEKLEKLFKEREGRLNDRLILELRNASIDELTESQLGLIRRRILATTTEIFEEPLLLGIGFKYYQLNQE
jgi:hypothetical protein